MVDGDSKPFSIERCRELLGTEDSGLSDEEIEAIRVQTDAWAHVLLHKPERGHSPRGDLDER